jgi:RNA polymerase sigma-70 factor (ECF subfamily)
MSQDACLEAEPDSPAIDPRKRPDRASAPTSEDRNPRREPWPHVLEPDALWAHIDQLYRAAWALCGSRHDAEDLVQETFVNVLKRPRLLRNNSELGYLLRALRNTYANKYRRAARRPRERQLIEDDLPPQADGGVNARELMEAIASVPAPYRDAVIAVDLVGLSYREAARALRAREATITTRLHRGRQHIARTLVGDGA